MKHYQILSLIFMFLLLPKAQALDGGLGLKGGIGFNYPKTTVGQLSLYSELGLHPYFAFQLELIGGFNYRRQTDTFEVAVLAKTRIPLKFGRLYIAAGTQIITNRRVVDFVAELGTEIDFRVGYILVALRHNTALNHLDDYSYSRPISLNVGYGFKFG